MLEVSSTARRKRRPQASLECDIDSGDAKSKKTLSTAISTVPTMIYRCLCEMVRRFLCKLLTGRTNTTRKQRQSGVFFSVLCRLAIVLSFLSVYWTVYYRLEEIELQNRVRSEQYNNYQHQRQPHQGKLNLLEETGNDSLVEENRLVLTATPQRSPGIGGNANNTLAYYLTVVGVRERPNADNEAFASDSNPTLEDARKGRERIISILEDAGIEEFDPKDVVKLPLWSSISELYYKNDSNINPRGLVYNDHKTESGPVILGLDGCTGFRETVPPKDRFLGVAGNFNSGTTAFGISLQKNCRFDEHPPNRNFVVRKRRTVFASNVNGMLSQVPWLKHKTADFRHGNRTMLPPPLSSIDYNHVLPIVLVRDPFYWMQSMCKEGYGVRWDHDSDHHCPNLIPNEYDRNRFRKLATRNASSPIPVWMGANATVGITWPSLIHYWNAWYGSYYHDYDLPDGSVWSNDTDTGTKLGLQWPRLIIRFEDTLFYPQQVMEKVCHCGGGKLLYEPSSEVVYSGKNKQHSDSHRLHDFTFEEAKPNHKHEHKNNFVTAIIRYGTNATRLRNMTEEDIQFAIANVNPALMKAFGYSYPIKYTMTQQD